MAPELVKSHLVYSKYTSRSEDSLGCTVHRTRQAYVKSHFVYSLAHILSIQALRVPRALLRWLLEINDLLPREPTDFRSQVTVQDSLLEFLSDVEHNRSTGTYTVAPFLDVQGAFSRGSGTANDVL